MDQARAIQFEIWRKCGPSRRMEIAMEFTAFICAVQEQRLRRRFPHASERELGWARVRQALRLPAGLTPP